MYRTVSVAIGGNGFNINSFTMHDLILGLTISHDLIVSLCTFECLGLASRNEMLLIVPEAVHPNSRRTSAPC